MSGTARGMVKAMRKMLGTSEHPPGSNYNYIVAWYNDNVDRIGRGPWCDMTITKAGADSGNGAVVGEFAYTVWHAQWFDKRGQWHRGTGGIRAGDVVFFDWSGTRQIGLIDHVGLVERVEGGKIYTIEGNVNNVCKRMVRDAAYIAGYGRPAYAPEPVVAPSGSQILREDSTGERVRALQRALNAVLKGSLSVDGEFGSKTTTALKAFQKKAGITQDGEYGPDSAKALKAALEKLDV